MPLCRGAGAALGNMRVGNGKDRVVVIVIGWGGGWKTVLDIIGVMGGTRMSELTCLGSSLV